MTTRYNPLGTCHKRLIAVVWGAVVFMIVFEHVTYRYTAESRPVLKELSLQIKPGESVAVMGANGSGKSTLARILTGLIDDYSGRVTINGVEARGKQSEGAGRLGSRTGPRVGLLLQDPDNQMVATVVDKEIAFALENMAVPLLQMRDEVTETMRRFQIEPLRRRLTTELSGGEKQRVALAGVMISRPPVLILDEPDSFLDVVGRRILDETIRTIRAESPETIEIRITQYSSVAREYPRLIVLGGGAVAADGRPGRILDDSEIALKTGLAYHSEKFAPAMTERLSGLWRRQAGVISVRANNIWFEYDEERPVLRHVNLELSRGETIGLVGETGSGKSSLGLLLCGILKPHSGTLEYFDAHSRVIPSGPPPGEVVGLFQQPERQFFLTSCRDEVAFGPRNFGQEPPESVVRELFRLVGLDPDLFADRDPFTLSMGEQRRLAFAAALSLAPSFVVFDEPTCGLDPEGVGRFIRLSRDLKAGGIGQVIVSHDGEVIRALADRVMHLHGGEISVFSAGEFFGRKESKNVVVSPADSSKF
jgi:energy-coupling factor transporter ATP-binding protein EcfA2